MNRRSRMVLASVLVAVVLAGFAFFLATEGLERADRWASIVAAFAALIGLALTVRPMISQEQAGTTEPTTKGSCGSTTYSATANTAVQQGDHNQQSNTFGAL